MALPSRRTPNLLHLLLFLALTVLGLILAEVIVLLAAQPHPLSSGLLNQRLQLVSNGLAYLLTFAAAWWLFPALWQTRFGAGLHWNARRTHWWVVPLGLALGLVSQGVSNLLPAPNKMPIDDLSRTPGIIWLLVVFGVLFAPAYEEAVFRGFLLPGLATAVDWLRLPRDRNDPAAGLAALDAWRSTTGYSTLALLLSSAVTSLCFAGIHALQLGFNWAPLTLLVAVSLVFCYVRIRTGSLAAATLVHASYNLSVFIAIYVATGGFRQLDRM